MLKTLKETLESLFVSQQSTHRSVKKKGREALFFTCYNLSFHIYPTIISLFSFDSMLYNAETNAVAEGFHVSKFSLPPQCLDAWGARFT